MHQSSHFTQSSPGFIPTVYTQVEIYITTHQNNSIAFATTKEEVTLLPLSEIIQNTKSSGAKKTYVLISFLNETVNYRLDAGIKFQQKKMQK